MRTFLIASAAVLSLTSIAAAQEAPALIYSDTYAANVQNIDMSAAGGALSITSQRSASVPVQFPASSYNIHGNENYSGR